MYKDSETTNRIFSKSPTFSSNYAAGINFRKSISPKRYCIGADIFEPKGVILPNNCSNQTSRAINNYSFSSGFRSSDNINKLMINANSEKNKKPLSSPKYLDQLTGIRKNSPKNLPNLKENEKNLQPKNNTLSKNKKLNLKNKIIEFKTKLNSALYSDISDSQNSINDENIHQKPKILSSKNSNFLTKSKAPLESKNTLTKPPAPVTKSKTISSEKRKLPARFLRIETPDVTIPKENEIKNNYIQMDLKLIQATNSECLLKNFEVEKQNRLQKAYMKKNSILKNVNEEESWNWSSPDGSPAKIKQVHFTNNI